MARGMGSTAVLFMEKGGMLGKGRVAVASKNSRSFNSHVLLQGRGWMLEISNRLFWINPELDVRNESHRRKESLKSATEMYDTTL